MTSVAKQQDSLPDVALHERKDDRSERILQIHPAWDKRSDEPGKNYGVHGMEWVWVLRQDGIAVTWRIMLPFMLPQVYEWWRSKGVGRGWGEEFDGLGSVDYHAPEPQYPEQNQQESCGFLGGKPCYCDGSATESGRLWGILVSEGPEPVWQELQEWLDNCKARVREEQEDRRRWS